MTNDKNELSHIAGTFLIQADGAFLNGAGLGDGEDRNVAVPKTFRDPRGQVPYVSAQSWKRWLRNTAIEESGWQASEPKAIGWNPKGNVNKIAPQLNPVEYPEDDIFGYMRAQKGQGRRKTAEEETEEIEAGNSETEDDDSDAQVKSVMRSSPFAASIMVSLRPTAWRGQDEGFVHLKNYDAQALVTANVQRYLSHISKGDKKSDPLKTLRATDSKLAEEIEAAGRASDIGKVQQLLLEKSKSNGEKKLQLIENATSPLPYSTRFYNTNLQAVFCLNYSRLGVFWNVGDRVELEPSQIKHYLEKRLIEDVSSQEQYKHICQGGKDNRIYRLTNVQEERKQRASQLLHALAVLRGGAKQAQFGTDVAPKVLILCGLSCGNPIFNHLFQDIDGQPEFKVRAFKEIIGDFADRIATPVFVGIRSGYLRNEEEVRALEGWYAVRIAEDGAFKIKGPLKMPEHKENDQVHMVEVRVVTPVDASRLIRTLL